MNLHLHDVLWCDVICDVIWCVRVRARACACACARVCARARVRAYSRTRVRVCVLVYARAYVRECMYTQSRACVRKCTSACADRRSCACVHARVSRPAFACTAHTFCPTIISVAQTLFATTPRFSHRSLIAEGVRYGFRCSKSCLPSLTGTTCRVSFAAGYSIVSYLVILCRFASDDR